MHEKIRAFVGTLFEEAPDTRAAVEIKEEITQNTIDRYEDLISKGKSEDTAYEIAIAGIGDVTDLLRSLQQGNPHGVSYTKEELQRSRTKSGILTSISIMLYILSVIPVIVMSYLPVPEALGVVCMFVMIAVATGLLIYNNATKLQYQKKEDSDVESFKAWNDERNSNTELYKSINSAIGALVVAIYLLVSFATGAWYITWVIFLIASAVKQIIRIVISSRK